MASIRSRGRCVFFFFQAEDGIRDLVRSGGVGDVYRGQGFDIVLPASIEQSEIPFGDAPLGARLRGFDRDFPVSYTHLTLPTSDLV